MLSDTTFIYVFEDDRDSFSEKNKDEIPKYTKIKVNINKKKILNEINKSLLLLIKNEAVSV
jgi:hypothetical protein